MKIYGIVVSKTKNIFYLKLSLFRYDQYRGTDQITPRQKFYDFDLRS